MENRLTVSSSPHIRQNLTTQRVMLDVLIALVPAAVCGTVIFGLRALLVMAACVISAVLSEFLFNLITKREQTVGDLSAAVTGLLLALNLRADAPIWQCVLGAVFAIVVVKCFFGGLGENFANPAIAGRVFLLVCFSATIGGGAMSVLEPILDPSLVSGSTPMASGATPLEVLGWNTQLPSLLDMFLGIYGGAIGETCSAALLVGYGYLVARGIIDFEVPLIFIGTVFALSFVFTGSAVLALYQILAGGLMLGAIFMATDYVTTPINRLGRMVFALGCGIITVLVRFFGSYPEGVSFAILFMNILAPYIEKWTANRPLGGKKA